MLKMFQRHLAAPQTGITRQGSSDLVASPSGKRSRSLAVASGAALSHTLLAYALPLQRCQEASLATIAFLGERRQVRLDASTSATSGSWVAHFTVPSLATRELGPSAFAVAHLTSRCMQYK